LETKDHILPFTCRHGKVAWNSPSNIALVKYWGKKGFQLPANPSVSMTLEHSFTEMEIEFNLKELTDSVSLDFHFNGTKNSTFEEKIRKFLEFLTGRYSWLNNLHLKIESRNTFPHSAGIASSASSMSALALCILSIRQDAFAQEMKADEFFREASEIARQASGSASRSVYGGYSIWGEIPEIPGTDDNFAFPYNGEIHPVFEDLRDSILLVSSKRKSVSSRAGHGLMEDHPFAIARYEMASRNARDLLRSIKSGDMDGFIRITEQEAMTLHGLMMSSTEPFMLLQPNSLVIMEKIRQFRVDRKQPVCFTIDAGPNIHLLYPGHIASVIKHWIEGELSPYLEERNWIDDRIGTGPKRTK
jgi:diphosphomevalonate decarboxylase